MCGSEWETLRETTFGCVCSRPRAEPRNKSQLLPSQLSQLLSLFFSLKIKKKKPYFMEERVWRCYEEKKNLSNVGSHCRSGLKLSLNQPLLYGLASRHQNVAPTCRCKFSAMRRVDIPSRQISVICCLLCEFSFHVPSPTSYPLASPTHNGAFALTGEAVFPPARVDMALHFRSILESHPFLPPLPLGK